MKELTDWMFRALMFESEAEDFRNAGIRLGADLRDVEAALLEQILKPFPLNMRNEALKMTRIYAVLYCFEQSVRDVIRERLEEKIGIDWWEKKVTDKIRKFSSARQEEAKKNSWLEGDKIDNLSFVDFGHLSDIIINNWELFQDLMPSQQWVKQRLDELEKARNFIAHNRFLLPSEFERIEMYVNDWNKQVGL